MQKNRLPSVPRRKRRHSVSQRTLWHRVLTCASQSAAHPGDPAAKQRFPQVGQLFGEPPESGRPASEIKLFCWAAKMYGPPADAPPRGFHLSRVPRRKPPHSGSQRAPRHRVPTCADQSAAHPGGPATRQRFPQVGQLLGQPPESGPPASDILLFFLYFACRTYREHVRPIGNMSDLSGTCPTYRERARPIGSNREPSGGAIGSHRDPSGATGIYKIISRTYGRLSCGPPGAPSR